MGAPPLCQPKHKLRAWVIHVVVFSVSIGRCVGSVVAIGAAGTAKCIGLRAFGRVREKMAIKHNVSGI